MYVNKFLTLSHMLSLSVGCYQTGCLNYAQLVTANSGLLGIKVGRCLR